MGDLHDKCRGCMNHFEQSSEEKNDYEYIKDCLADLGAD